MSCCHYQEPSSNTEPLAAGSQFSSPYYYQTQPPQNLCPINISTFGSQGASPASSLGTPSMLPRWPLPRIHSWFCHTRNWTASKSLPIQTGISFSKYKDLILPAHLLKKPITTSMKKYGNKLFSQLPTITSLLPLLFNLFPFSLNPPLQPYLALHIYTLHSIASLLLKTFSIGHIVHFPHFKPLSFNWLPLSIKKKKPQYLRFFKVFFTVFINISASNNTFTFLIFCCFYSINFLLKHS